VWFEEAAPVETPIYDRTTLPIGTRLDGPAIISQLDSTTVIPPGATVTVDKALNLLMELGNA
jgi:N-methylhydantoinase A